MSVNALNPTNERISLISTAGIIGKIKRPFYHNPYAINECYLSHVRCGNCGNTGLVDPNTKNCPDCGNEGQLTATD